SGNGGWGGNDTIQLGAGILASEVSVAQANNGRDLVLTFIDGGSITIKETMVSGDYRVERLAFADGMTWTHNELVARSMSMNATQSSARMNTFEYQEEALIDKTAFSEVDPDWDSEHYPQSVLDPAFKSIIAAAQIVEAAAAFSPRVAGMIQWSTSGDRVRIDSHVLGISERRIFADIQ
ncbi:calcium-binding protein, partial [Sphingopyxis sp. MWB1]|uniref:calcium-binding protein n=1 Tax=Sphingopyxis sp. MWB1 TaxID=1537715 RepID=UPI00051A4D07